MINSLIDLKENKHNTILEINLNALEHNLNVHKAKLSPDTQIMCMVKAFGYGTGDVEIAQHLEKIGVTYFGVAYTDEGVSLRASGISSPIMVLNTGEDNFSLIIKYNLEPVIYSFKQLEQFVNALKLKGLTNYPIHLELETGMNRLGICESELMAVLQLIKTHSEVKVKGVFSHLSASGDPENDEFTRGQISLFSEMSSIIQEDLTHSFLKHICNSAGIVRFPMAHFDIVRLGIGLYGVSVVEGFDELKPVAKLVTTITQIRNIKCDESVSYGRNGKVKKGDKIAIIPIGYADGLRRSLSNGVGSVNINGALVPIIGDICMDMTMIDVTTVSCEVGSAVELFGNNITIEQIAKKMNTIPYEVLTSISQRVKRVYLRG